MLPNLIVIGAGRAGTTSLHRYLDEHPDIFMAREKELDFFVEELNWPSGLDWYESQFPEETRVRGESSPFYAVYPRYHGVPGRMARLVPDAKLLYIVRDPIDRLLSQYSLHLAHGHGSRALADVLAGPDRPMYVDASRYWTQLERYLEYFPSDRILVVDLHELRSDARAMRRVFTFLEVDPDFTSAEFGLRHNQGPLRQSPSAFRWAGTFLKAAVGPDFYQRLRPMQRLPGPIRARLTSELDAPQLDPAVREELEAIFREESTRLREFSGLPLAGWSV